MKFAVICISAGFMMQIGAGLAVGQMTAQSPDTHLDLPTSKALVGVVPGNPQRINSLPMSMAVSPDRRYVVTVNAGLWHRRVEV